MKIVMALGPNNMFSFDGSAADLPFAREALKEWVGVQPTSLSGLDQVIEKLKTNNVAQKASTDQLAEAAKPIT